MTTIEEPAHTPAPGWQSAAPSAAYVVAQQRNPVVAKIFWVVSMLAALVAGLFGFVTVTLANGAPQEAAGAAVACLIAIVPYVFARGVQELLR
jgi:hypothetical protein